MKSLYYKNFIRIAGVMLFVSHMVLAQHGSGGLPGAFLRIGVGARALGMGSAFTAVSDDASATYWNPAGLPQLQASELYGTYSLLSMNRAYNYLAYAHPTHSYGTFGFSWIGMSVGGIEERDIHGFQTGEFDNLESAYYFSWGFRTFRDFYTGISIKYLSHQLQDYQSNGMGFDLAFLYQLTENFKLGFVLQDISTNVQWNTIGNTRETLPKTMRIGGAISFDRLPITIGLDYSKPAMTSDQFHVGVEYQIIRGMGIRAGYDASQYTAGAFINLPVGGSQMITHYSMAQDPVDQTMSQKVSLCMCFTEEKNDISFLSHESNLSSLRRYQLKPYPRVIRIKDKIPNYAVIDMGEDHGIEKDVILFIYRDMSNDESKEKLERIGRAYVVKVKKDVSAVKIMTINGGYQFHIDDVLIYKKQ